jgi:hypothetical protein
MIAGEIFLWWLSGQPDRAASIAKAKRTVAALDPRFGEVGINPRWLLSDLQRTGHIERTFPSPNRVVATIPTFVVVGGSNANECLKVQWIGARCERTIAVAAQKHDLAVTAEPSLGNCTRWFLSGTHTNLEAAANSFGGTVQYSPGTRILLSLPTVSPEHFVGELEAIPYDECTSALSLGQRDQTLLCRKVACNLELQTGLYRVGLRPHRWLWHQAGTWRRLEGEQRLVATWYLASILGRARLRYYTELKILEIDCIGVPLPVLCDRALRLRCGSPTWTNGRIRYLDADGADVAQLGRVMNFQMFVR